MVVHFILLVAAPAVVPELFLRPAARDVATEVRRNPAVTVWPLGETCSGLRQCRWGCNRCGEWAKST